MTGRTGRTGGDRRRFARDERAVSVTVTYALNLMVAALLVGGVLTATGGMVEDRRDAAVRSELEVVGERVATDLSAADRLAVVGSDDPTVSVSVTLPARVGGNRYDVTVEGSQLELVSRDPEVRVTVGFHAETPVAETTVPGGDLRVEFDTDSDRLEVRSG
ncbi:hypothetical protein NGM10_03480 [Halorussus salilacus]|uniref:DUF7266 family protein n=1 Tax=Halorussus salilacus TaxID=2953750 RepID=UPI00209F4B0C|nr:hypothetical protein [Halorussus salilacus]USZ68803.1 hypothetical protein NGM10_03480 [Halorussus salilacus]